MIHAALIVLGEDLPLGRIAGFEWPEYRLRVAVRLGARHVVMVADRVTVALLRAVDRAKADGIAATIVQCPADIGDLFHPDEMVLVMGGVVAVEDLLLRRLANARGPAVLCVSSDDARLELIDAQHRWLGFARLDGAQVRDLSPAASAVDWDVASMLMRVAVRGGAERLTISPETRLIYASDARADRGATRLAIGSLPKEVEGWATQWLVDPFARSIALFLRDRLPVIARFGFPAALLFFATGVTFAARGQFMVALLAVLSGVGIGAVARVGALVTGVRSIGTPWFRLARNTSAAATVFLMAASFRADHAFPVLALVLFAVIALNTALPADLASGTWRADVPGVIFVLAATSALGASGVFFGLSLCVMHGFASLYWLQNRLSRALTPSR